MKSPLYIPSYEDAAGTDPVTPAVSFTGGVVSKNYIPIVIDWNTLPSQVWIRDGALGKCLLNKDSAWRPYYYYGEQSPGIQGYKYSVNPVFFKNGYVGWAATVVYNFGEYNGSPFWTTIESWGRAYDTTQSLGFSPCGKYSFLNYKPYDSSTVTTEKPSKLTDLEVSEEEPILG